MVKLAGALTIVFGVGVALPQAAMATGTGRTISTTAGADDLGGFSGDGGPATAAALNTPTGVAVTPDGGYLIADSGNDVVRRVSPTGRITTVAGNGGYGSSGDGGPATAATFQDPLAVAATPDGGFLIADPGASRIRRVSPTGTITTAAGNGARGFSGDGGPASAAALNAPYGVAALPDGGFLIADLGNYRVRRVLPNGTITTVAGNGTPGFSGDGGPATRAQLGFAYSVAVTADGGFVFADNTNRRVRRVAPTGIITTVAGTGVPGSSGDGGQATAAPLNAPTGVAVTPDGGILIADQDGQKVRRVAPTGVVTTVAGTGTFGWPANGDGGPATAANLFFPFAVASTATGGVLIAEMGNHRVRFVNSTYR